MPDKDSKDDDKEQSAEVETTPVQNKRAEDDEEMKAGIASMGGRFTVLSTSDNVAAKRAEQESKIAEMFDFNDAGAHTPKR
jgi:hypothetical protein